MWRSLDGDISSATTVELELETTMYLSTIYIVHFQVGTAKHNTRGVLFRNPAQIQMVKFLMNGITMGFMISIKHYRIGYCHEVKLKTFNSKVVGNSS